MIPEAQITEWRNIAPWPDDMQVEQDLILSRILVDIFSNDFLNQELAFRGGTALHKLFISPAVRYSEDIDLVRTSSGPIKAIVDTLRDQLEPWLGKPYTRTTNRSFKLLFYFNPEVFPTMKLRIKIEINVREPYPILDRENKQYSVDSEWFSGSASINTFHLDELIATKIRALYQRSKGRDLFDLWLVIKDENLDIKRVISTFHRYMEISGNRVSKLVYQNNLMDKLNAPDFLGDINPLLSQDWLHTNTKLKGTNVSLKQMAEEVIVKVISRLDD